MTLTAGLFNLIIFSTTVRSNAALDQGHHQGGCTGYNYTHAYFLNNHIALEENYNDALDLHPWIERRVNNLNPQSYIPNDAPVESINASDT